MLFRSALPTSYEAVQPAAGRPGRSRVARVVAGCAVILALTAVVALVGQTTEDARSSPVGLLARGQSLNALAVDFLRNADSMSVQDIQTQLSALTKNPRAELKFPAPTMMLASGPQQLADGQSLLCKKKDLIIQKFDELLKKLGGEELSANITMGRVSKEWKEAMEGWLDSESEYRLTVEKAKEAAQGADFAENEYEKWQDAHKMAARDLEVTLARHAEERQALADERELIKQIMRYIGVLHDVKATEKSIAAGGRDSVKDSETGVSDPYAEQMTKTKAELHAKFAKLQSLALKTKLPGQTQKLAMIDQHLAVYSETQEVAKILKDMLSDIESRLKVIDTVDEQAKKLVTDTMAKMVEWEKKLVVIANEKDKAKEKMMSAKLEREKLNGDKKVAHANYDSESAAYKVIIPPFEREIYVITMIKIKINEHCDRLARGEESTFGQ